MRTSLTRLLIACWVISSGIAGCVGTTAPSKMIPTAESSTTDGYGAWAHIQLLAPRQSIDGELIAVASETVFVMTTALVALPREQVREIILTRFQQEHAPMILWSMTGTLSTISHGFFLLGTLPMWIVSGSLASAKASKEPIMRTRSVDDRAVRIYDLQALSPYARFPQGFPRNLDRALLQPRR